MVTRGNLSLREGSQDLELHEQSIQLVGHKCDRWLHHIGKQTGKSKSFTGVALDTLTVGGSPGEIRLPLIKPQISPAGEKAEPGQDGGSVGANYKSTEGVEEKKQGGEVLDAHFDQALEDSDRMFRNELLEGDEEGTLDGDTTADLGKTIEARQRPVSALGPNAGDEMLQGEPKKTYPLVEEPVMPAQIR